jgi:hypothetical protein
MLRPAFPTARTFLTSMNTMLIDSTAIKWCSILPFLVNSLSRRPSGLFTIVFWNRHTSLPNN